MIESHFQYRGFDVRLKEHNHRAVYYYIRTPVGPYMGSESSLFAARRTAIEIIDNDLTQRDWTLELPGAVQCTTGDGDDQRRVSRLR